MARTPSPLATLRLYCLSAALALLGTLGCVDNGAGGTTLYVYDKTSSKVQVWADVNAVYTAAQAVQAGTSGSAIPAPDRTITSPLLSDVTLAWGGLAVDNTRNRLYLVAEGGTIYAISKANTQNGSVSQTTDITTLTLGGSSDRYTNGAMGQVAMDQTKDVLYVMETTLDGNSTRVWYVSGISTLANQYSVPVAQTFNVAGDTWGCGLAAVPGGGVIGLFGGGNTVYRLTSTYTGPRMWLGQTGSFPIPVGGYVTGNVIIGQEGNSVTGFSSTVNYGSLGYDAQNSALYVFGQGSSAVSRFSLSQFNGGDYNQAPKATLSDPASVLANLRVLSHPPTSDWMLGASFVTAPSSTSTGSGSPSLLIWKSPSNGGSALSVDLTSQGVSEIRGMAIGGTN